MSNTKIIVSIALGTESIRVGTLWFHMHGARENTSFEYNKDWLNHPERFALEPALRLTEGSFHTRNDVHLFGAIGDSAPDRWGRVLMRRAEILKANTEQRHPITLLESDYLLGVNDEARQGALRFSIEPDDAVFLQSNLHSAIPPLISLPRLLSASERFVKDDESAEDLRLLLAPGSSLGGARPKASVRDRDNSLAIAKFPRKDDEFNVVLWEAVALKLAKKAGIQTPDWRLEIIQDKPVLIIKRFDRHKEQRIPYLSAMSMLSARDNEEHSYIEMAYAITQNGAEPTADMSELWRRIVYTILISNTDDHLRNHGFLYERHKGWRLSPAFDMNPTPIDLKAHVLTTSINFNNHTASLDNAMSVIKDFRLSEENALQIIKEVHDSVSEWRNVALSLDLSKKECDRMASAFNLKL